MRKKGVSMWISAIALAAFGFAAVAGVSAVDGAEFKAGQVWSYHTREHESGSRLHIVRVTDLPKGETIYHIYVDGLAIINPRTESGVQDYLPHAPVSAGTLRASVVDLLDDHESHPPDISEGYAVWREAFDKGEGGYFTIPVAKIIEHVESVTKNDG